MGNDLLEKLNGNLKWFVLEVDFSEKKNQKECLSILKKDISQKGYELLNIFENEDKKGLYHVHCKGVGKNA